jgi:hypothetical protein
MGFVGIFEKAGIISSTMMAASPWKVEMSTRKIILEMLQGHKE